jgi:hypothetical protein
MQKYFIVPVQQDGHFENPLLTILCDSLAHFFIYYCKSIWLTRD